LPHFNPFTVALLNLFLNILGLQRKIPNASAVFNGPIYKGILPNIRFLLPVPNFPKMISPIQIVRLSHPVVYAYQARSTEYALKSAHKRAIILC